jgi:hypothetical protein
MGPGCCHHQNREKRRGRLFVTTIFDVFVLVTTKCGSFCVATKSESFLSPPKPKENLKSPPNPGVAPKASDFGRVTTKTEITPNLNHFDFLISHLKQKG